MRRLALALVLAVAALGAAAAPAPAAVVGIADQKPDMFADPRFQELGIKHARISVPWDVLRHDWQTREMDDWMRAAFWSGVQPLLSFSVSRVDRKDIPTPSELRVEFRRLRARYPWAKTWATWNEANHCGSQLCHRAKLVVNYYRKMRLECPRCKILAAELLDMPNMLAWVRRFRRHSKVEPKLWGLHNYVEVNRFQRKKLRKLLRRTKGRLWLTETGGIVKRRTHGKKYTVKRIPESKRHARKVTRFLFRKVLPMSRRIKRVYLYHWNASTPRDSWDSALIGPTGRKRPAFAVLESELERLRRR